jgi:hypothetical protein
MNGGKISGNTVSSNGGGVYTSGEGIYTNGASQSFTMNGGIISGNTARNGGGVYADYSTLGSFYQNSTFIKESSVSGENVIYGSEAVGIDLDGVSLKNTAINETNPGHAVYVQYPYPSSARMRNTTAWQADRINARTSMGISFNGNPPFGL